MRKPGYLQYAISLYIHSLLGHPLYNELSAVTIDFR